MFSSNNFSWIAFQQEPGSECFQISVLSVCVPYTLRCFAAVKMKAERFQNSTSNKSRRERRRDTFAGPLLPGYNM